MVTIQKGGIFILKIVAAVLSIPILCTILVGVLASLWVRLFAVMVAYWNRPDLAGIMFNRGQYFALESVHAKSSSTIVMHLVCDGTICLERLRQQFQRQLILSQSNVHTPDSYSRFRQLWTQYAGYTFWQWESDFSVEKHIREYDYDDSELALPAGICSEDDLKRITAAVVAKPYPSGQSPWEILVIENYKSSNNNEGHPQFVLVLRIHHLLADGISIVKLLLRLFDQENLSFAQARFRQMSLAERIWKNVKVTVRAPFDLVSKFLEGYDGKNCWYMMDTQKAKKYHAFFSNRIPVNKVKEIMRKHKVCYNAAIYSVTAGAITKLMTEAGQRVPAQLSCVFPHPLPNHPGGLVNHFSYDVFTFHPALYSSAVMPRLENISGTVLPAMDLPAMPTVNDWLVHLLMLLPAKFFGLATNVFFHPTLAMTNIPGPDAKLDVMGGGKLVEIIPAAGHPASTAGANAMMVSAGGKQRIVLTVQRVIFEGYKLPCNFASYIEEEIQQLLS